MYNGGDAASIAHHWAHQSLPENPGKYFEASTTTGNFYYKGSKIWSYGSHYQIAGLMPDRKGHPKTVLFNAVPWGSQQTSGHCSLVRQAIPSDWQVIEVKCFPYDPFSYPDSLDHAENLKFYFEKITEFAQLQARARKRDYSRDINKWGSEAKKYIAYFKIKKKLYKQYEEAYNASESFTAHISSELVKETANQRERRKKRREKTVETLLAWYAGHSGNTYLYNYLEDHSDVRLRLENDLVYTSKNFYITAAQARAAFNVMRKVRTATSYEVVNLDFTDTSGTEWHSRSLNPDGSFHVGCHFITFEEAEALALRSGWITEASILSGKESLRKRMLDQESLFTLCQN